MIFHEVELSHTKEIMDSYEVNPIIAKYVEHRGFTKKTMKHSTHHFIITLQI